MLKNLIKNAIGEDNIQYLKDKWYSRKNASERIRRAAFYAQIVRKGDLCIDVGANYGNRVEALIEIGGKVIAVEPQKECCNFLRKKFGHNIEIVNMGLGAKEGKLEFYQSNASTLSTFSQEWINKVKQSGRFERYHWDKKIEVEMTTLDALIARYGKPAFIKIDVEGYELEVLSGLTYPVDFISFEYTVPEQTEKMIQCIQHIQSLAEGLNMECNYSIGESMVWASNTWLSSIEMIKIIQTPGFVASGFGDIYIRTF